MRLPRIRFRIRTLLLIVALSGLGLAGVRIYRDGIEAHWLVLKLRYGSVEARRAAAHDAWESERTAFALAVLDSVGSGPASPRTGASSGRSERRAALLIPALIRAAKDPDAGCRASALKSLDHMATLFGPASEQTLVLRQILAATRDHDANVRATAVDSLVGLAQRDTTAVIDAFRSALNDPSVLVRREAASQLGVLGAIVPETRPDVASILIPLLASREDSRVRVPAAWGLCVFGRDHGRHPPGGGRDVVPALVAALHDTDVDVRRTAAFILSATRFGSHGETISAWNERRASILPALLAALSDDDTAMREESALAFFGFGQRNPRVIALIEQAAREPNRPWKARFDSALKEWEADPGTKKPTVRNASPSKPWND